MKASVALRSNSVVHFLISRRRKHRDIRYERGVTEVVVDGFPRSGNSWLYNVVQFLYPDRRIAHHMHSVVPIRLAAREGVPAYCPIRNPADAITSFALLFMNEDNASWDVLSSQRLLTYCTRQYIRFHELLVRILEVDAGNRIRLVPIDSIFDGGERAAEQAKKLVIQLAQDLGPTTRFSSVPALFREVQRRHETYDKKHRNPVWQTATPSAEKEGIKLKLRTLLQDSPALRFEDAQQVFTSCTASRR